MVSRTQELAYTQGGWTKYWKTQQTLYMNKGKGDLQWSSWIFLCQWNLKFFILPLQKITEMVPELEPSIIEQIRQLQVPSQYWVYPSMAVDRI